MKVIPGKWYAKEGWKVYYFVLKRYPLYLPSLRYHPNIKGIEYCEPRAPFFLKLNPVKFEVIDRERIRLVFKEIFAKKPNSSIKAMLFKMVK
jgi:hypothetical protein